MMMGMVSLQQTSRMYHYRKGCQHWVRLLL